MYFNATHKFLRKLIIPALVFIALTAPSAWATSGIKTRFLTAYGLTTSSRLAAINGVSHCGACHFEFSSGNADVGNLNPYGDALVGNTSTTTTILSIGTQDSDGDGFNNDTEIKGAGYSNIPTFPGLRSANVNLVGLPTGITLADLTGFLTPAAATQSGSLQVTLGPAAAVTAGAQWNVDGGAWQNSAAVVTGLSVGSHTVNYKAVTGWTAPASESASITNAVTTSISRSYTVVATQSGSLRVTLGPAAAVTAGAQWNVDGGAWQNSAAVVTGLSVGSHTVNYKAVTGWTAPASESASITNAVTTAISRSYTVVATQSGSLRVTLGPAAAVTAGAQWNVDGGAWQNSAAVVTGLSVGSHTVNYKAVTGWTAPASESASITNAVTTAISRTYTTTTQQAGSLQVTLSPAAAVTAGAQWNVDGGAWRNSAATVTGLSVGSHTVNYKAVTGWTAPASESVSITNGVTTASIRIYTATTQQSGSLRVTLGPAAAVTAGTQWNVDGGAWRNSAAIVTGLSVGSHTVNYKAVTGWTAPASESISITNGVTTAIGRSYTNIPQAGSMILVYKTTLNINPSAFRAPGNPNAGWRTGSRTAAAWMVINVNLADPNAGNIQAALIPFGYSTDPNNGIVKRVYVNDAVLNINVFSILPGLQSSSAEAMPDVFLVDFTADNIAAQRAGVGIVAARMQGTVNMTTESSTETDDEDDDEDERWTETGDAAVSLRGVAICDSLYDDTFAGSGMISAKLDSSWTERANDSKGFAGEFADVVTGIKTMLESKGYSEITQTP